MRFIQVGVGGFGRTWLPRIQRDHTASLAAIVDVDRAALAAAREATGLSRSRCLTDFRKAFETVEADAVLNVTPPPLHHEVAQAAFESGLHVLTEKPVAETMAHGRQMVEAARDAGRTLMVSQNYRFRPWARTMRRIIAAGQFGPPDSMAVEFEGSFRLKMDHPLVRDMSIHHFDLMRAVTGREPVTVFARTWQPSWSWFEGDPCAAALFEFEGGLEGVYEGSWVSRGRETSWDGYWCLECPQAVLELRRGQVHVTPAGHPDTDSEVQLDRSPASGQTAVLTEFQQAVAEGREPESSGRDNLTSLAMTFAVMESSREQRPVRIADLLED
jgi:predicted dehydrogenase